MTRERSVAPAEKSVDYIELRVAARQRASKRSPGPEVGRVEDITADSLRVRRYLPPDDSPIDAVAVFCHGGYFVFGDLDLQDNYCRHLSRAINGAVYSMDYALAPEAAAAASIDDVLKAVRLARTEQSQEPLLLCGDSAGGTIAFQAAARLRDLAESPAALLLTNPNLDLSLALFDRSAPLGPDPELLRRAIHIWAGDDTGACGVNPMATNVRLFPPTLIAVGSLDALAPEARAMHHRLSEIGNQVNLLVLPGVGHGFMGADDAARDLVLLRTRAMIMAVGSN